MISIVQLRKSFPISIALFFVGAVLTLFLSLGTSAQNQTLFADDFEDGNADGWSKSGGSWAVTSDGSQVYRQSGTSSDARARAGSTSLTNYAVQARVKPLSFNGSNRFVALLARVQSMTSYYYLALRNNNQLELKKLVGGSSTTLAAASFTVTTGTWYNYYFSNSDVGVACQANAGRMVQGNYFEDVEEPMTIHYSGPAGRMVERSNVFVGTSGTPVVGGSVIEPSDYYGYSLQNASDIKTIVTQGAGVGKIGF